MSAASFDPRIRAYYGDGMLRVGFMPLPHLFLRHYRKLGLSHLQALFVLQLIEIVWDLGDAPASVSRLAERLGVDRRTVQICAKELQELGLVEVFDQWDESGAQIENGYDLSALFQRIIAIDQQPTARTMVRRSRQSAVGSRQSAEASSFVPQYPNPNTQFPHTVRSTDHGGVRSEDRGGVDVVIAPPVVPGSQLNTGKKKTKIPQEQEKKQQQATDAATKQADVVVVGTEIRGDVKEATSTKEIRSSNLNNATDSSPCRVKPNHALSSTAAAKASAKPGRSVGTAAAQPSVVKSAWSLRWNVALDDTEVALSRTILQRCGVHGEAATIAAATLHPAEAWALRLYARAARLTPAWIARQVYDWKAKRARTADLSPHYDEAGRSFAVLDLADAERLCDMLDAACPMQAASVVRTIEAALGDDTAIVTASCAGWTLMAEQRGGPAQLLSSVAASQVQEGATAPASSLWQRVQGRLKQLVPPDDYSTWLSAAVLLDHDGDLVVIGTANIFVRDTVDTTYRATVEAAFQAELGHTIRLEVVIGSTPLVPD